MIHTVKVTNYLDETLTLDIRNPYEHGLAITNITGVGGPSADINLGAYATTNGGYFNSARALSRVISFDLLFLEAPTIDAARHLTYRFFPVTHKVTLEFITDTRHTMITGYVESNDATIFSSAVGTTISVVCPKSSLEDSTLREEVFYGEKPMFEFPFSNESLTTPLMVMGDVRVDMEEVVFYSGDTETGMVLSIKVSGEVKNIKVYNARNMEMLSILTDNITKITGKALGKGDEIIISTISGDKYARLLRDGKYTNILNAIDRNSNWLVLARGDNLFTYTAEEGSDDLVFSMTYKALFEGI